MELEGVQNHVTQWTKSIALIHDRPLSWCGHLEFLPLISVLPNQGWMNKIVWFLIAKYLLAFIIVIRYKEHDKDGGSMSKFYYTQVMHQIKEEKLSKSTLISRI